MLTNPALLLSVCSCFAYGLQPQEALITLPLAGGRGGRVDCLFSCFLSYVSSYSGTMLCVMITKTVCRAVFFSVHYLAVFLHEQELLDESLHAVYLPHIPI